MFWDRVSGIYDLFGKIYNGKVNRKMCAAVVKELRTDDRVLECACGTGLITAAAANVIHLLDDPYKALSELDRVCRPGGKLIIPTYVNKEKAKGFDKTIDKAGANFRQDFTYESYQEFFAGAGFVKICTKLIDGRVPCAVAVISKQGKGHFRK